MLLKVYTANNDCRVIENIEDIVIHKSSYGAPPSYLTGDHGHKGHGVYNTVEHGPQTGTPWGPYTDYSINTGPYLWFKSMNPDIGRGEPQQVKVIDFLKDDGLGWRRIIIECWAYLCNDEGKTIEKIMNETR